MTTLLLENFTGVSQALFQTVAGKGQKKMSGPKAELFSFFNDKLVGEVGKLNPEQVTIAKIFSFLEDLYITIVPAPIRYAIEKLLGAAKKFIMTIAKAVVDFVHKLTKPFQDRKPTRSEGVANMELYLGRANSDKEGNAMFSNGANQSWCADTHKAIHELAQNPSKSFLSSSVGTIRDDAKANNCYIDVTRMSDKQITDYVKKNIKPMDDIICSGHVMTVKKVNPDGSITFIHGNSGHTTAGQEVSGAFAEHTKTITQLRKGYKLIGFVKNDRFYEDG